MPARPEPTFVKSDRDARLWQTAKARAEQKGLAPGSEAFYRYANATLQHMRLRTGSGAYRRKLKREQKRVSRGGLRYESVVEMVQAVRQGAGSAEVLHAAVYM